MSDDIASEMITGVLMLLGDDPYFVRRYDAARVREIALAIHPSLRYPRYIYNRIMELEDMPQERFP